MAKLKINRGTTYRRTVRYKKDGVATTLAGATVRFTMKAKEFDTDFDDSDAIIQKDVTDGTSEGVAVILIAPADTAELAPKKYFYDIKVQEAGGDIYKVDEGTIELDGSPTNRLS